MKEFPVTLNFNDSEPMVGRIQLTDKALKLIEISPEHCITFSFDTSDPKKWEVVEASLIPNSLLPKGDYEELRDRTFKKPRRKMSDWKQITLIWGTAFIVAVVAFFYIEWGTRP